MIKVAQPFNCTSTYSLTSESPRQLISSLLESNLQHVLQSVERQQVARSTPAHDYNPEKDAAINAFLQSLEQDMMRVARHVFYSRNHNIALDDLYQEGMIAAWQIARKRDTWEILNNETLRRYCLKSARGIMLNFINRGNENKLGALSLDEHLEVDTRDGGYQRDIEDKPVSAARPSIALRRRVLAAMRNLTTKERMVVMATFRIDTRAGKSLTEDEVKTQLAIPENAYYNVRARALRKLSTVLQQA